MKKIYYLMALISVVFASCDPLSKTYKDIDANPTARFISFSTTTSYASTDAAKTGIAGLLNTKYADMPEGSTASVTFSYSTTVVVTPNPDNLLSHVAYTLVASDYPSGTTINTAQAITFLNAKYPTPVANQLAVLTYNYVETNVTPAAGVTTTDSYMYIGGVWTKIYTISPAQYTLANRGVNGYFLTADLPNLPSIFNTLLLTDANNFGAKVGDIKYVSYKYNTTAQNVMALMFDGTNWVFKGTLNFLKFKGTWIPDPTIYVNEPAGANNPDYAYLKTLAIGSDAARTSAANFGDFDMRSGNAAQWQDSEVTAALAAILLHKFPTPTVGIPYKITYVIFTGSAVTVSKIFVFNGTAFVVQQ